VRHRADLSLIRRLRLSTGARAAKLLEQSLGSGQALVRSSLVQVQTVLARDGLVRQNGVRRSGGKPADVYDVTPAAEQLLSKAYGRVLGQVLDVPACAGTAVPVRAERFTYAPLQRAEFDELLRAAERWGLDDQMERRAFDELTLSAGRGSARRGNGQPT
jgi:hypothetical protein